MTLTTLWIILAILAGAAYLIGIPVTYGVQKHGSIRPSIWASLCWPLPFLRVAIEILWTIIWTEGKRLWNCGVVWGYSLAERYTPSAPGKVQAR